MDVIDALDLLYAQAGRSGLWRAADGQPGNAAVLMDDERRSMSEAVAVLLAHGYVAGPDPSTVDHSLTQPR